MSTLTDIWESPENQVIRVPGDAETEELVFYLQSKKIGLVAEIARNVPPKGYGSIQIVIDKLAGFLRRKGIETVFFGTGDSTIEATEKVAIAPSPPLKNGVFADNAVQDAAYLLAMKWLKHYFDRGQLHLAHLHILYNGPPEYLKGLGPTLWTLHWNASVEKAAQSTVKKVSATGGKVGFLSKDQMQHYGEGITTLGVTYNPVDVARIEPALSTPPKEDAHLVFLGRCDSDKRPDLAARIAIAAKTPLKMVIQCLTSESEEYYRKVVEPLVSSPEGRRLIDCRVKEIGNEDSVELFRNALATLFPITWNEPCSLTPPESLAAGTPIVAFDWGYMPELITPDVGYVVQVKERMVQNADWSEIEEKAVREAASAVREVIPTIDRRRCREHVEKNFSLEVVGRRYLLLYAFLLGY